jgi:hypothetical protein
VQLFYFVSCFCIEKKNPKQIRLAFCLLFFGSVLVPGILACDSAIDRNSQRSSALESIPACLRACARLVRSCVRARPSDKPQYACAIDRISFAIERTCTDCYISMCVRVYDQFHHPALELNSVGCTNRPEAVYVFSF